MIVTFFQIYCDAKDCVAHFPAPRPVEKGLFSLNELRVFAHDYKGWTCIHGHDYCPKHGWDSTKKDLKESRSGCESR